MTKKDYINIGSALRDELSTLEGESKTTLAPGVHRAISVLCRVFAEDNPRFMGKRFLEFVAGRCGPSGGRT